MQAAFVGGKISGWFFGELLLERDIELADAARRLRTEAVDEGDEIVQLQRCAQRRRARPVAEEEVAAAGDGHRIARIVAAFFQPLDGRRGARGTGAHSATVRFSSHASASPDSSGSRRARTCAW